MTRTSFRSLRLGFAFFLVVASARAEVRCAPIFGDHMVLQRERAVPIWGDAAPGEHIGVDFAGHSVNATADAAGRWRADLPALVASSEPRALTIRDSAGHTLAFSDVLVGEVWFCSGQSNMEKPLGPRKGQKPTDDYEQELARSACPTLRLFQVPHSGRTKPDSALQRWWPCDATALTNTGFSAAAYYFGRDLQRQLGVPVGLIHSSYGGTRIEAWMPPGAFASDPKLRRLPLEKYDAYLPGVQATELYASMVAPYVPFALRGFLWYQGETNGMNAEHLIYAAKQRALIASWRAAWQAPDAPFYFALLAPFGYSHQKHWAKQLTPDALPALWEAQLATLDVPRTGVVTTTDLAGNARDIHPTNKRDVGLRFARLALAETYGRPDAAALAPRFASLRPIDAGRRLELAFAPATGLHARDAAPLTGFVVAGADRVFHPADATLIDSKVIVSAPDVPAPVAVRLGWDERANPNLVNAAGLPALPFRTDDWPLQLEQPKSAAPENAVAPPPR